MDALDGGCSAAATSVRSGGVLESGARPIRRNARPAGLLPEQQSARSRGRARPSSMQRLQRDSPQPGCTPCGRARWGTTPACARSRPQSRSRFHRVGVRAPRRSESPRAPGARPRGPSGVRFLYISQSIRLIPTHVSRQHKDPLRGRYVRTRYACHELHDVLSRTLRGTRGGVSFLRYWLCPTRSLL